MSGPRLSRAGDLAPFSDQGTSLAAAREIAPHLERLELRVLRALAPGWFGEGMTDEEVERATGLRHQTASARRRALVLKGLVVHTRETRKTSSGRSAQVWVLTEAGRRALSIAEKEETHGS